MWSSFCCEVLRRRGERFIWMKRPPKALYAAFFFAVFLRAAGRAGFLRTAADLRAVVFFIFIFFAGFFIAFAFFAFFFIAIVDLFLCYMARTACGAD